MHVGTSSSMPLKLHIINLHRESQIKFLPNNHDSDALNEKIMRSHQACYEHERTVPPHEE